VESQFGFDLAISMDCRISGLALAEMLIVFNAWVAQGARNGIEWLAPE
tara:strand:+ start:116 stop:259 length:144 start_codon:yes stop_codon:yes gene_type:complete